MDKIPVTRDQAREYSYYHPETVDEWFEDEPEETEADRYIAFIRQEYPQLDAWQEHILRAIFEHNHKGDDE